jgi:hypothetical protein
MGAIVARAPRSHGSLLTHPAPLNRPVGNPALDIQTTPVTMLPIP